MTELSVALHTGQLLQPVPGGIGRYVRALVRALPTAGIDVHTFAAGTPTGAGPDHVDLGFPHGALRYELWHRFRRPVVRVDTAVVHAPSLAVPPTNVPLVVTVHDLAFMRFPEVFTARGVKFHTRGLDLARSHAAAIVVPSEFTRDELVREGFDADRIVVAPHGAPPPSTTDPADDSAILTRLGITPPFALAVGTIEPRKQLEVAVGAVERVEDCSLVIAGPKGWNDVSGLDHPEVHVVGTVDEPTLDALYRSASATLVPSRYEGFGLPALEAMAHGCPVLATDASSLPEVVGDAGILLPDRDVDAWAAALSGVVHDATARDELVAAGREQARRFTWERSAAAHAAAYEAAARR